ncbi:MAG: SIMPL domain-containing protein [Pseudomonadota bacterium]
MPKVFSLLLLSAVLLGMPARATELTGTPEALRAFLQSQVRTIVLRDDAEETGTNDIAKITLVIRTKERELSLSLEANNEKRDAVSAELLALGLSADDIQSSKYSASPQFGWFGSKPSSFEVVNTLVASVDNPSLFQRVAAIADSDDAVSFGGVAFEHSEEQAFENKVRDKAVDKVLEQARYFEQKLGLRLKAVSFQYGDVFRVQNDGFAMLDEIVVTRSRLSSSAPAPAVTVPSFDEVVYRATASVTFEVIPGDG